MEEFVDGAVVGVAGGAELAGLAGEGFGGEFAESVSGAGGRARGLGTAPGGVRGPFPILWRVGHIPRVPEMRGTDYGIDTEKLHRVVQGVRGRVRVE